MELTLHDIHSESIELALDKARQYRSLLEPEIAESICQDILHIEADNQDALVIYILALTDQLHHSGKKTQIQDIEAAISKLESEYQRLYYKGLMHERRARFMLTQTMSRAFAYDDFIEALKCYQAAEPLSPNTNDESTLRWNSCIRTIEREALKQRRDGYDAYTDMES